MKIKYFYAALAIMLVSFLTIAAINSSDGDEPVKTNKDIIKFSHSFHKELAQCEECHTKVKESTSLNTRLLPEKAACATCHDVNDEKNCTQCHYGENF